MTSEVWEGSELKCIFSNLKLCGVEWCPNVGYEDIVACCEYTLKSEDERKIEKSYDNGNVSVGGVAFYQVQIEEYDVNGEISIINYSLWDADCGLLDIKWCRKSSDAGATPTIACALASGQICILTLIKSSDKLDLHVLHRTEFIKNLKSDSLCLSLDWNADKIIVSESSGSLALWEFNHGTCSSTLLNRWAAHSHRNNAGPASVWIAFFNKFDENTIISGADDCLMKCWDIRCGLESPMLVSTHHEMGVTSGEWHHSNKNIFVTGSYDESIRLWDIRNIKAGPTATCHTGGGLWRVRFQPPCKINQSHPEDSSKYFYLLAACTHNGAKIVKASPFGASMEVVANFSSHKSMVYGASWYHHDRYITTPVVATCSFHDRRFSIWKWPQC